MALIFGVESSCDDTSVGIVRQGKVLSNVITSQLVHAHFGGVVPELAARDHMKNMVPVAEEALRRAGLSLSGVDVFAVTQQPGLIGCLLVGAQFTKSLAISYKKPFYSINHLKAHVVSPCIDHSDLEPPFLCLLASGGHTQIVLCKSWLEMELIGETVDDAAGEAFDKSARLLGFMHAGGMEIDKLAVHGDAHRFKLPLAKMPLYEYSFSGLKTAIRYLIADGVKERPDFIEMYKADLAASIQCSIIESLLLPFFRAAHDLQIHRVCIAGGVSANSYFKKRMLEECNKRGYDFYYPAMSYCSDNGAMIAFLAEKYHDAGIEPSSFAAPCIARHGHY